MKFVDDLAWWHIVIILLALCLSIVTVKFSMSFNITEWLKQRTVNKENKARRLCPHTIMDLDGATNQLKVMSQYTSPFGTTAWICSRCGDVSYSEEEVMQNTDYWGRNIQRYIERNEQIEKLLK